MEYSDVLSSTSYLVLAALQDGPLHGYAVLLRLREFTPGERPVPVATLYATLDRLASNDLVEVVREEIVDGRARRTYGLTRSGRSELQREAKRLAHAASLVTARSTRGRARVKPAVAR